MSSVSSKTDIALFASIVPVGVVCLAEMLKGEVSEHGYDELDWVMKMLLTVVLCSTLITNLQLPCDSREGRLCLVSSSRQEVTIHCLGDNIFDIFPIYHLSDNAIV